MPLHAQSIGESLGSLDVTCDRRWLMSFAAGVPDERPLLYDTVGGLAVHPLFPVAAEWQLIIMRRDDPSGMSVDERQRGIHVGHDLVIERPVRPDETVHLSASLLGVGRRRAGATQEVLFVATDEQGDVVWRTRFTSLYLGVELVGEPTTLEIDWPITPGGLGPVGLGPGEPLATATSTVRLVDAHVYSECARIWNPIHTDPAVARAAGLADPILHGTATLARGVSTVTALAGADIGTVTRVACRFVGQVALDSTITARLLARNDHHLWFDVVTADGGRAIADGLVTVSA
jgi:acyl dehydratase